MARVKQEYTEVNGVRYALCPICGKAIHYPEGVYFRNGIELHAVCTTITRMRREKIAGIDCNK